MSQGDHHSFSRWGGGVFVVDKLFMSTQLDGALQILILLHIYIEEFLK